MGLSPGIKITGGKRLSGNTKRLVNHCGVSSNVAMEQTIFLVRPDIFFLLRYSTSEGEFLGNFEK